MQEVAWTPVSPGHRWELLDSPEQSRAVRGLLVRESHWPPYGQLTKEVRRILGVWLEGSAVVWRTVVVVWSREAVI